MLFIEINCWIRLGPGRRQPPAYSVAAQMARLHRLGRAHSHEGVTGVTQGYHYHTDPDTDQGKFVIFKSCGYLNALINTRCVEFERKKKTSFVCTQVMTILLTLRDI